MEYQILVKWLLTILSNALVLCTIYFLVKDNKRLNKEIIEILKRNEPMYKYIIRLEIQKALEKENYEKANELNNLIK